MAMLDVAIDSLLLVLVIAVAGWAWSLVRSNVTIVDSLWSLFILAAALMALVTLGDGSARIWIAGTLVTLWALRLSLFLTLRNAGHPEDRRYAAIRARNEPGFRWKSVYLVFGFQGVLACIVALPFLEIGAGRAPVGWLDLLALVAWTTGFVFQAAGDAQLARFRRDPTSAGRVLDTGLWRYTRHPNYFGEACMAWGLWLFAASVGGYWTIVGPLVMTFMLLKVSGVALLEADIGERRPGYAEYVARTNAFVPGRPRTGATR